MRLHVVIDAATLERERVTGHPRLLRLILNHEPRTALTDVHVDFITINGREIGGGAHANLWPVFEDELRKSRVDFHKQSE